MASVERAVSVPAVAADAVDEAFLKALDRWERVQAMRSPGGWVYRVAVHEARRQLRRQARESALAATTDAVTATLPPPGGEAWLLVADLPPRQRAAIVLRHAGGLTEAEVGAALGVARSTVSSALADAHRTLGRWLADERRWPFVLAVARSCGTTGCDVEDLGDGAVRSVAYSDAVRDRIKVRPGDLVAVRRDEAVWRWWHGAVEEVSPGAAVVSRKVTRADGRRARRASVPAELEPSVRVGDRVWFGGDEPVVVASATTAPDRAEVVARDRTFRTAAAMAGRIP